MQYAVDAMRCSSRHRHASARIALIAVLIGSVLSVRVHAQDALDADSPVSAHGSASGNEARALVTLLNPPTPAPLTKVRPLATKRALTDSTMARAMRYRR
ncbi:hypothetical protein QCE64_26325 [Caballeronia sp. LZ043]|uniref:hypothetical protein n=1 Tax=Caballeronia sp. LZ032 TaxID=3038565 RepID=UPI0028583C11|nr:hypothetical protein [Caballeronia sp. LZ032]MDR5823979.1 hypothetical protein [Caballeronia sp. LZ043]MDR5881875.1 hypothetical protein [Caballeronia sp. LZ032]